MWELDQCSNREQSHRFWKCSPKFWILPKCLTKTFFGFIYRICILHKIVYISGWTKNTSKWYFQCRITPDAVLKLHFWPGICSHVKNCSLAWVRVGRRLRGTFSTDFEILRRCFDGIVIYFFNSDFKFFHDASEFSLTSLYVVFIFSSKFMLIFLQSVSNRDLGYR